MNKKKPLCFIVVLLVYWLVLYREVNKNTYKKNIVIINIFFLVIKSFFYCNKKFCFIESKCFYRESKSLWRAKKNIG